MYKNTKRRAYLLAVAITLGGTIPVSAQKKPGPDEAKVRALHENILTIDTHVDTPMSMLERGFDIGIRNNTGEVDLPRMKEGGLDAIFFAVYTSQEARTEKNYAAAYSLAHTMIDTTVAAVTRNSELAVIALTSADAHRIEKTGKRAIYLGMENGFPLAKEINRVEEFYRKGIRYITLCHSSHNDICDSSSDRGKPEHNGLSPFGRKVVMEMNRLGMIIDVSHISDQSFYEVLSISLAPVIASHSSVRAIARHKRNLSDDMIRKLAEKGGVIQICLLDEYVRDPDFNDPGYRMEREMREQYNAIRDTLSEEGKKEFRKKWLEMRAQNPKKLPSVQNYVDHIDHVVQLAGIDHVGIGSDFDGGGGIAGCSDVSQFPQITGELMKRGYSEPEIRKIWGGNFFRVFRKVESIAGKISSLH